MVISQHLLNDIWQWEKNISREIKEQWWNMEEKSGVSRFETSYEIVVDDCKYHIYNTH